VDLAPPGTTTTDQVHRAPGGKGLRPGVLGLRASIVIGLASTAPAYSLAASVGLIVMLVGVKAPAVLLLAFVPMYLIAVAFRELNHAEPDCGTSFTWAGQAFGPWVGWMAGWGIIAADVIVMANLAQIAGRYSFLLFGADELADDTLWVTVVGVVWILAMTWVCHRGIEISARLQYLLLGVEMAVLAAFTVVALVRVAGGAAALAPGASWLWPGGTDPSALVDAVLIAVFLYWGWDTAAAVNEETADPHRTPGRAGVLSTLLLLVTYLLVTVAAVAFAGTGAEGVGLGNQDNAEDVLAALGPAVFGGSTLGGLLAGLLVLSVLTSAAASTLTTILPTARGALAMAASGAIPRRFAAVHPVRRTPTWSTWGMGLVSVGFYAGLTAVSGNVLADSVTSVGMLIAFYYGLTGFACMWRFRHRLRGRDLWVKGVAPGLGGLLLLAAFVLATFDYARPEAGRTTVFGLGGVFVVGVGSLLAGVLLMIICRIADPTYFRRRTPGR